MNPICKTFNILTYSILCRFIYRALGVCFFILSIEFGYTQTCLTPASATITTNPDTYYHPGTKASLPAGATSITLGAANSGSTSINSGDLILLIQMQGAQFTAANDNTYGSGVAGNGSGYLSNANLLAGNMEFVIAANSVPLSGGNLTLVSGTKNAYKNTDYGSDGQYRYQLIRVPTYYDLTLNGTITAPKWNGATGGVVVLNITDTLKLNGQSIDASGAGFRGGGGRSLTGGSGSSDDYITLASNKANGSKGEGIAGTPRFLNNNGTLLDSGASKEGYPSGSYCMGSPGNAGGGGTDGNPASNDENSGGGGGSNGGTGGKGGNSWNSNLPTGGIGGAAFIEKSAARLVMGGGGGAGTTNNATGTPANGFASSGAAGGGIIILIARNITGTGILNVNGANANNTVLNDGSGGGGAGGSALVYANTGLSGVTVNSNGGNGGTNTGKGSSHGPGGGGSGGVIYSHADLNAASTVGGASGTTAGGGVYNASAGTNGTIAQNTKLNELPPGLPVCNSVLSLDFLEFTGVYNSGIVTLKWKVANAFAVEKYVIERSNDGDNFNAVGTAGGNDILFNDPVGTNSSNLYYRIKLTGRNGQYTWSKTIHITTPLKGTDFIIFPNPVKEQAAISLSASNNVADLILFDLNGKIIWKKAMVVEQGANTIRFSIPSHLPNGIYSLQVINGASCITRKLQVYR